MFIVIDGPNGAGKTTLINQLKDRGYDTLSSPNGTDLAKFLRPVCRGTEPWEEVDKTVQFLAFSAARLDEYIKRVKDKSHQIIADRWWTSTYTYQCVLQGLDAKFMEYTIHPEEKIDLVIILTADSDTLISRVEKERLKNPDHGKCSWTKERKTMERIAEIYVKELPDYLESKKIPHMIIDSSGKDADEIEDHVLSILELYK